ncbi:unnamed protein product [Dovyalis caffra]|uniref:Partial AB-hydrolase lipase domain-containing protein n=1 Tax=Dovyalis caffra TaxID=77055 RepID=A0AAV1QTN0_9ROSI|nr:unnamed protein product [Dovyalis caffra]
MEHPSHVAGLDKNKKEKKKKGKKIMERPRETVDEENRVLKGDGSSEGNEALKEHDFSAKNRKQKVKKKKKKNMESDDEFPGKNNSSASADTAEKEAAKELPSSNSNAAKKKGKNTKNDGGSTTLTSVVIDQPPTNGTCANLVKIYGYKCQELEVVTDDGYILSVQRIPEGRVGTGGNGDAKRQPVLIQHGVLVDGMTWLQNQPEQNLPTILADQGFDVWISNTRGTKFSSRHTSLHPNQQEFWNWSWDELAKFDLPALFDYVYNETRQKIHYVGHSQGTLTAMAALSEGLLVEKIKSAALLSPVAYLKTTISLLTLICKETSVCPNCCLNGSTYHLFANNQPQPTAMKNVRHFGQTIRNGFLAKYDYGSSEANMQRYGKAKPPVYNLSNIPSDLPLFLSYGLRDGLSDVQDVNLLLDILKPHHDADKLTTQYIKEYAHMDFIFGVNAKDVVYNQEEEQSAQDVALKQKERRETQEEGEEEEKDVRLSPRRHLDKYPSKIASEAITAIQNENRYFLYPDKDFPTCNGEKLDFPPHEGKDYESDVLFDMVSLVGSCNGVSCQIDDRYDDDRSKYWAFLWNPSIRKTVPVPHPKEAKLPPLAEVYSLKSGCWKMLENDLKYVIKRGSSIRKFGEMTVPDCVVFRDDMDLTVTVFGGLLSLAASWRPYYSDVSYSIWQMKEYGDAKSWTKLFNIEQPIRYGDSFVGFKKNGELFLDVGGELTSYSKTKNGSCRLRGTKISRIEPFYLDSYVESLVLLNEASWISADNPSPGNEANRVSKKHSSHVPDLDNKKKIMESPEIVDEENIVLDGDGSSSKEKEKKKKNGMNMESADELPGKNNFSASADTAEKEAHKAAKDLPSSGSNADKKKGTKKKNE